MVRPKYQAIINEMVRRIREGAFGPGERLPGHLKLAEAFEVSSITAERALSELARLGLIERRPRAGSYVLGQARTLSRVFVVVPDDISKTTLQLQEYWRAILAQAQAYRLSVQIVQAADPEFDDAVGMSGYVGQGLILLGQVPERIARSASANSVPCVYLGQMAGAEMFCVLEDRRNAARELVAAMIADGCRRIGFVGALSAGNHRLARDGYLEGIEPLGLGYRYVRDASSANVVAVTRDLLAEDLGVDGVVVMGAGLPVAALPVVWEAGHAVKLGCLAESPTILQLGHVAYIGYYSQIETGKLAFDMLHAIASGQVTRPEVRYSAFRILRPGEKAE